MVQQTFLDRSWRVLILEEHDRLLVGPGPEETTWQDYSTVVGRIRRLPFEVVAAKPLVESASATALMDAGGAVKAVWMLRHYAGGRAVQCDVDSVWTTPTGICSRFVPGTRWTGDTKV